MKISLFFNLTLFILISCKTTPKLEMNIPNLRESFIAKNETQFLNQFPKDFNQFHNYFGWNSVKDKPEELYFVCNDYIDYWFDLLNKEKYKEQEKHIIGICTDGKWEPDAVNYFQDKSIDYIRVKNKYDLINKLSDGDAKSVLTFLFDSPHPQMDAEFVSNLSTSKKKIVNQLFESKTNDEASVILSYSFDLNKDGVLDKVNVRQENEVEDDFDRKHFGLTIEILKGEAGGLKKWTKNKCVFEVQNNCVSEGFLQMDFQGGLLTVMQQTCYDYNIVVNSNATFSVSDDELYLQEYRESYFNKADHDQDIPTETWTKVNFGRIKFENVSEDFLHSLRLN